MPKRPGLRGLRLATSVALLAGVACARDDVAADGPFYARRTLEVIVPFGPGGGTDTWTRMLTPHLQRHLGGRAAVQVRNVPGASSVAGTNEFALRARRDGSVAVVTAGSTFLPFLLREPMVRYDFADFTPILASPVGGLVFVGPDMGVRTATELAAVRTELVYGGISAAANDLMPLLAFELLGLSIKPVLGYSSKGATRVAFEQGETDIEYQTMPGYLTNVLPLVEAGEAVPLFSFGILDSGGEVVRDPAVPELPSLREVYVAAFGREPVGPAWDAYETVLLAGVLMAKVLWLHGDAPAEAVDHLRSATARMLEDEAFLEAARVEVGDYPFYHGTEVRGLVERSSRVDRATMDWLLAHLWSRYGIERLERR